MNFGTEYEELSKSIKYNVNVLSDYEYPEYINPSEEILKVYNHASDRCKDLIDKLDGSDKDHYFYIHSDRIIKEMSISERLCIKSIYDYLAIEIYRLKPILYEWQLYLLKEKKLLSTLEAKNNFDISYKNHDKLRQYNGKLNDIRSDIRKLADESMYKLLD